MGRHIIEAPDGTRHVIDAPDGASEAEILAFISQQAPKLDTPQRTPQEEQAFGKVDAFRKDHPILSGISDTASAIVRGTPVGSWLDEFTAATLSALPGGKSYDEIMATQKAMEQRAQEDSATVATLPVIGDVSGRGLTKVAGGIASAPIMPYIGAGQGAAMLPRMGAAGATGAGYGTIYGAGEGEGSDRVGNAAIGGAMGGLLGLFMPPIGQGLANAYTWARDRVAPLPGALSNYHRGAVDRVRQAAEMDNLTPQAARVDGPNGMLADAGQNLTTLTEGLAQQAGQQRGVIVNALEHRRDLAPARIRDELNTQLAPEANMPATEQATRQHYQQAAGPLYDQFYAMRVPQTPEIGGVVERIRRTAPGIFNEAMKLAVGEGVNPRFLVRLADDPMTAMTGVQGQISNRVWQGVELDYLKRAVDDAARKAGRGTNGHRILSGLAARLRTSVDEAISPGNPAQSPWAQARGIAGEGIGVREAMDTGRTVFSSRMDPQQLAEEMAGMSQAERQGVVIGGRDDLRRTMGRAATNFGPNGDASVRRTLNNDFNRENLNTIAGPRAAGAITRRIDAENQMAETANQVLANSATARRQSVRDIIPRQYDQTQSRELSGITLPGAVISGVQKIANILSVGTLNARNARIARDMAQMLVAQGMPREQIAQGLMQFRNQRNLSAQQRGILARLAEGVLRGAQPAAISGATD